MSREPAIAAHPLRGALVWSLATGLGAALLHLLAPLVRPAPGADFVDLLTSACATALLGCALWAWLATSVVVAAAVRGAPTEWSGCPSWLRRTVLLGCGVLLSSGPLTSHADPGAGQLPQPVETSPRELATAAPAPEGHTGTGAPGNRRGAVPDPASIPRDDRQRSRVLGAPARSAPQDHDLHGVPMPALPTTPARPGRQESLDPGTPAGRPDRP